MDVGAKVRRQPGVLLRPEEDEAFLFDPGSGALKLLNPTGVEVWALLEGARPAGEVVAELARRYPEADPVAVAGDVDRFLDDLVAAGLAAVVAGD